MKLREILSAKGAHVHTIEPNATLNDVVRSLVRFNIGSLVVCEIDQKTGERYIVGMVTERDILRTQAQDATSLDRIPVCSVLVKHLITAGPDDAIDQAMLLMTMHRVRHLPIMENGQLCGLISIGDIVKAHHDELELENHFMKSYIQGEGAEIATIINAPHD